jgi:hypothetical protein
MTRDEVRHEVQEYVKIKETTYTQKISNLKEEIARGRKQLRSV